MNWVDYTIIFIIALSIIFAVFRGFIRETLSLLTWILAFYFAFKYYDLILPYMTSIDNQTLKTFVSMAIVFFCIIFVGMLIGYLLKNFVASSGLSSMDCFLGIIFGIVRGVLFVSILLIFVDKFANLAHSSDIKNSILLPHFDGIIKWLETFFHHSNELGSNTKNL